MITAFVVATLTNALGCTYGDLPARECGPGDMCLSGGVEGECVLAPNGKSYCAFPSDCPSGLTWGIRAGEYSGECVATAGPDGSIVDGGSGDGAICTDCPDPPALRWPWNGAATGSIWATSAALAERPRRPSFRWDAVADATSYEIQVDDSCTTPGFATCDFPSPEIDEAVTETSYATPSDLPVSAMPPVGRRYHWRVRSCSAVGCGAWSAVRYVDVARLRKDFDGDGFADTIIGAPEDSGDGTDAGRAYLFWGWSGAPIENHVAIPGPGPDALFGTSVAFAGDVNADGFSDLVIGAPGKPGIRAGEVVVILGGLYSVLDLVDDATLVGPSPDSRFGASVAGAGDVNGDGFADIVIGAPQVGSGLAYVHLGGPTIAEQADGLLVDGDAGASFGASVSSAGDVDADGLSDVIVGAPEDGTADGRAFLYLGATSAMQAPPPDAVFVAAGLRTGVAVAGVGDRNGDSFGDLAVGTPEFGASSEGVVHVFYGGPGAFDEIFDEVIAGTDISRYAGNAIAGGDFNGDGLADIAVGASAVDSGDNGAVFVSFAGGTPALEASLLGFEPASRFGTSVATADINADGCDDLLVGAPRQDSQEGRVHVYLGAPSGSFDQGADSEWQAPPTSKFGTSVD
jgi:hypothetical protein